MMLAAFTWGYQWQGKHVFEVDNSTVVAALRSGSCRDSEVMRLLRLLHFAAADTSGCVGGLTGAPQFDQLIHQAVQDRS